MKKCPEAFTDQLLQNIVLSGGNSQIRGFKTRLENELESLKPAECQIRIAQVDEPNLAVWRGLKNLTFSDGFAEHAVTQAEWQEKGARAFLKCVL